VGTKSVPTLPESAPYRLQQAYVPMMQ